MDGFARSLQNLARVLVAFKRRNSKQQMYKLGDGSLEILFFFSFRRLRADEARQRAVLFSSRSRALRK